MPRTRSLAWAELKIGIVAVDEFRTKIKRRVVQHIEYIHRRSQANLLSQTKDPRGSQVESEGAGTCSIIARQVAV